MAVKVRIPTPLRAVTGGKDVVEVEASTVRELIENLDKCFPGIKDRLCDEQGKLRRFINIYLNEEDVRFLEGEDTEIKDGDEVSIIPAISGGKRESVKVYLTFPDWLVEEPVIHDMHHHCDVVFNIRSASVSSEMGLMALEIQGEEEEVSKALEFLTSKGVLVEPIEKNVIES